MAAFCTGCPTIWPLARPISSAPMSVDSWGVEPTGRSIRFPFTVYVRFKDGLLSGERFFYDLNMIMAQLGQPSAALAA